MALDADGVEQKSARESQKYLTAVVVATVVAGVRGVGGGGATCVCGRGPWR